MLVAYRLAGLSALETYYARVRVGAQFGAVWLRGLWLASARSGRVTAGWPDVSSVVSVPTILRRYLLAPWGLLAA